MRGRASSQTKKKSSCFYFNRFRYCVVSCVKIRPLKVFNLGYFNLSLFCLEVLKMSVKAIKLFPLTMYIGGDFWKSLQH